MGRGRATKPFTQDGKESAPHVRNSLTPEMGKDNSNIGNPAKIRYVLPMPLSQKPRTILIDVIPPQTESALAQRRLLELDSLTRTYGGMTVVKLIQRRATPDYRTYAGSGKVQEVIALAQKERVELLIVNNLLKPKQLFAIEELARAATYPLKVWDRVDLILKIFSKHAASSEAKLQIKLAAIRHMGPRIFGMGMEMMQQSGGIGGRAGAGESNTEMMKRHLFQQEQHTKKELERVAVSRAGHRSRRDRVGLKTVSIVGYTNAGKSSLLNALTKKGAYVADALFATLDTRVGKLWTGDREVLLSDTIGFIQDLPPQLIDAFRSTLDETMDADLLLHVIDVSDPYIHDKIAEVEEVLAKLKVEHIPKLYVFNKTDRLKRVPKAALTKQYKAFAPSFVSAHTGTGLEELRENLIKHLGK
jgi:GTP-binding protein HflX